MPNKSSVLFNPRSLSEFVAAHPQRMFWCFALMHLLLWTALPSLTSPNAPLDVIEGYAWGREWLLGTYKHPPMQSWWLQILAIITDRAPWAHFLASQLAILFTFWAVWQTGRQIMSEQAALVGTMLLESIVYYNFTSVEFNPNVLQLPFWALTGLSYYRAMKDNRCVEWMLLGVWAAGGMYSKYSSALLLIALAILTVMQPQARRRLRGYGPYLAVLIAVVLFAPHLVWLKNHDFLPFTYATERLGQSKPHTLPTFIFLPLTLLIGQLVVLLSFVLLFLVFYGRNTKAKADHADSFDRDFLKTVTFGPFVLIMMLALFAGFSTRDMWGVPFWSFIGLWSIVRFKPSFSAENMMRFFYACGVLSTVVLLVYMGTNILGPYVENRTKRIHFPGKALATYITDQWHDRYHQPLRFVVGDTWPAGNVAYYAPERPHVYIMGDKVISPWIKTLDFDTYGGVIVWCVRHCLGMQPTNGDMPAEVAERFPQAQIQSTFSLARQTEADIEPVRMGWAIIPPKEATPAPEPVSEPAIQPKKHSGKKP